jgi:spermine/spermidine synthase
MARADSASFDVGAPVGPPLWAVALLSSAALACEILLMRLFSIIQWHHFAYMMISVALLGYGAAGTFVALAGGMLVRRYAQVFVAAATLFAISAIAGFLLAQRVGFNPLEMLWDPRQPLRLCAIYVLLFVPFFCAATAICLTFTRFGAAAARIYSADIVGAGVGSLAILAAMFVTSPMSALLAVAAVGIVAAALAAWQFRLRPRGLALALLAVAASLPFVPGDRIPLHPSEFKELSQALQVTGARIVAQRSSPLGLLTVVESPVVPFRQAPGPSALTRYDGRREPLAYLDYLTSAAPYHLIPRPRVLVLGAGAGADVLAAIYHDVPTIDAVELNPQVVDLVEHRFAEFSGRPYSAPAVRLHIDEARGFVTRHPMTFDIIDVALLDAFGASSAGLYALSESYLYTIEAMDAYLDRLNPGGVLSITRWVNLPPRDVLKLFGTAIAALEGRGVADPGRRLALIRGWKTATVLVKNGELTNDDIANLREFCRTRSFDADYFPGIQPADANRYNVLDTSDFHDGALALIGPERASFIERYKFAIAPATDDRPHFFHFFRWRTLPELLALKERGGLPLLEGGYPILVATLVQALLASIALILLPLLIWRRGKHRIAARPSRGVVAVYFTAIGFAFMFVEIAFIQKFVLFLAHPLYAVAVVLSTFLIFAGLGSSLSPRLQHAGALDPPGIGWSVAVIAVLALMYLFALPIIFRLLMPLADALRIAGSIVLIAPLGFAMGMPFPRGLARLATSAESLIPWAWGINACASVVAAILATVLAIHLGFAAVIVLAVALYAIAFAAWRHG